MSKKFSEGDKVRIRKDLKIPNYDSSTAAFRGKVGRITIDRDPFYHVVVGPIHGFTFHADELDEISETETKETKV